jgi:hypothetical protein
MHELWQPKPAKCSKLSELQTEFLIALPPPHKTMVANPRKLVEIGAPLTTLGLKITHNSAWFIVNTWHNLQISQVNNATN